LLAFSSPVRISSDPADNTVTYHYDVRRSETELGQALLAVEAKSKGQARFAALGAGVAGLHHRRPGLVAAPLTPLPRTGKNQGEFRYFRENGSRCGLPFSCLGAGKGAWGGL